MHVMNGLLYTPINATQSPSVKDGLYTGYPYSDSCVLARAVVPTMAAAARAGPHVASTARSTTAGNGKAALLNATSYALRSGCTASSVAWRVPTAQWSGVPDAMAHLGSSNTKKFTNRPMHIADVTTTASAIATPAHHSVWLLPSTTPRMYTAPLVLDCEYRSVTAGGGLDSAG